MGASSVAWGMGRAKPQKPKYVFLMIGDGMGTAQRDVAERYARMKYPSRSGGLVMNKLPVHGLTTTSEVSGKVTDSAAAGTALACGAKTVNGALGLAEDLQTPLRSMAYDAKDAGKKVGIVTSVPIDHATPAAFYAQVPKRGMYYEIDEQIVPSGINYFAGEPLLGRNKAKDRTSPDRLIQEGGYQLVKERSEFDTLKRGADRIVVEKNLGYAIDGKQEISLADMTQKGLELLDNKSGFFMMVEGGKIDWSGHANDLATNIKETLAFDEAIRVVLDFCKAHPDESLLVVTADHETGGLQLDEEAPAQMHSVIDAQQHLNSHYVDLVKGWKRSGSVSADAALEKLSAAYGFSNLTAESESHLLKSIKASLGSDNPDDRDPEIQKMYGRRDPATVSCLHELAYLAGAQWTTFGHTDFRVKTTAWGRWADQFGGDTDNTDIALKLKMLIAG
jgi:alkaline phosphatase